MKIDLDTMLDRFANKMKYFLDTEVSTLDGGKSERSKSKPKVQKNFPPPQPEYTSQALFFKHLVSFWSITKVTYF